jgi:hypothetical protein
MGFQLPPHAICVSFNSTTDVQCMCLDCTNTVHGNTASRLNGLQLLLQQ